MKKKTENSIFPGTDVPLFRASLLNALKQEEIFLKRRRRTRAYSYGAVAALLLITVGFGYFRSNLNTPASDLITAKIEMTYGFSSMESVGAAVSALPEIKSDEKTALDVKKAFEKKAELKTCDMFDKEELLKSSKYAVAY